MTSTKTIIEQLKSVKASKGYTHQDIVDMTSEIGMPVSISTVRRVFGDNSDDYDFRYESTIQPIATVLLGIGEEQEPPANPSGPEREYYQAMEAMKSVLRYKNELVETLQQHLKERTNDVEMLKTAYNEQSAELNKRLKIQKVFSIIMAALFLLMVALFVGYLFAFDIPNPDYGIFRSEAFM